jgi:hypothetical protein
LYGHLGAGRHQEIGHRGGSFSGGNDAVMLKEKEAMMVESMKEGSSLYEQ